MLSCALDLAILDVDGRPAGVSAQIHNTLDDPSRNQTEIDVGDDVRAAGATVEIFDDPGIWHLFTDQSFPVEYDETAAGPLWYRVPPPAL